MLQQMRSMKMVVFWFVAIVFLVIFVFGSGGLHQGQGGGPNDTSIAVVNGEKIQYEVYNRYVTQLAEMERQRFGREQLSTSDYDRIEAQAWDGLISEILIKQEAAKMGLRAGEEEIASNLTQNPPAFIRQRFTDESGQFNQAAFQSAVNDPSFNWGPVEEYLRSALPSLHLDRMVRARAQVGEDEVRAEFARRSLRTTVRYAGVAWPTIDLGGWTPSESDLRTYYDQHPERFARGETVSLELIKAEKKPSADDVADAMSQAEDALADEKKGDSFAEIAEIYSDDPSSSRGGDLGWQTPASLPAPLGDLASKLAMGQTSDAVHTDRGIVILHADSVRTGARGTEMRLRQVLIVPKASGETLDSLRARGLEAGQLAKKDFAAAARKLGAPVTKLEPVEANGFLPGIGFSKRLIDWAFKAQPGEVSEPVGTDDAILIARLVTKNAKSTRPFEEVKDQAKYGAEEQAKKDRARATIERVAAAVKAGTPFDAAVKAAGLKVETPAPFTFYESVAGVGGANEFTAVAGALAPGRTSGAVETPSGTYVLQAVSRDPFDDTAFQAQRQTEYQTLLQRRETAIYEAWMKDLRDHAAIKDQRRPRV